MAKSEIIIFAETSFDLEYDRELNVTRAIVNGIDILPNVRLVPYFYELLSRRLWTRLNCKLQGGER